MSAEIWIGGRVPAPLAPALCRAIAQQCVSLEWGEACFRPETVEELQNACQTNDEGGKCDCERPGFFHCGVAGILAHLDNGKLAKGAAVKRCDLCDRYPSDEAAYQKLVELGIAPPIDPVEPQPAV